MTFRDELKSSDPVSVEDILKSSGFFYDYEVKEGKQLVENTALGIEADVSFLFLEENKMLGFTCYGKAECSLNSYFIYWIAVSNECRGKGMGGLLLLETERRIRNEGGAVIWMETSSIEKYSPTRKFYLSRGYEEVACLKDFYKKNDSKIIYRKDFSYGER
jgi:ribosomal protein S18 acetylase RimI-like enzyme